MAKHGKTSVDAKAPTTSKHMRRRKKISKAATTTADADLPPTHPIRLASIRRNQRNKSKAC
nr:uncharacterized protein LOC109173558 [Ipomoea batatas]GMD22535.1 uncharacterized protein LOC109173558 [Ipomoea batatas]GME01358.1 uncharacterized protein LOC109173558 [Ipomoea batatas]GME05221.1 uncharacterized protein LOC109173558 [Ipomoea batatas]